ncbi:Na(+)/citrate cotransporter-like isoform 2-T2 [Synchiropus picturatus]
MAVLPAWLRMLRRIWESRNLLIIFFTPLFLLPLVFSTPAAACAFVIILMAVYWCTEVLPLAVTALLPTILFPLLGIMESKDVCMQYLKDTNMLFVGGLMVAIAVEHWNLHKRIALRVLLLVGVRPALLMLGFMSVTAFLSMWISNTATTAMMVPIVQAVLDQLHGNVELNPRKDESHQGPVSQLQNAAKMDPVEADDKTSPEDASEDQKSVAKNLVATKPTPQDKSPTCQTEVCCPLEVEELSNNQEDEENMGKGLLLSVCYAASIGGTATLTGTGPNLILVGQMTQLFPHSNSVINFASWFAFAFPTMILMLTLTWFWLQFLFVGCNLRRAWGCGADLPQRERAAYELIKQEHGRLGRMTYAEANVLALFVLMVALWFTRDPKFMEGWATRLFNSKSEFVTDATVSLFISVLLFVLPSEPPRFLCRRSDSGAFHQPLLRRFTRTRPLTAHLASDTKEVGVEHHAAAGRRLRLGQGQRSVRPVSLARRSDDIAALSPIASHRRHHLPPNRHLHRVCQQRGNGNALPAHPGFTVPVDPTESSLCDDTMHAQRLLCLYAAGGHAT